VVLLILESLGSTELVFILVMALVFFGPRKLPQISRSLGKNLADLRRASEDFKRTWDREVSLEEAGGPVVNTTALEASQQHSILGSDTTSEPADQSVQTPTIAAIAPDRVIARHAPGPSAIHSSDETVTASDRSDFDNVTEEPRHSPKSDWL
jgi:Sec-independent protein translocase protein TatA